MARTDAPPECPSCGLIVYIEGASIHPCCAFWDAMGAKCPGCWSFESREEEALAKASGQVRQFGRRVNPRRPRHQSRSRR